ncbi:MAG: DNA polymerase Y family protein [Acidimicrobiales bacterium]|nr:DNA polymerase Y family protein [Acidimicrobiales bacterium]
MAAVRTLVVRCSDWPIVAAGHDRSEAVAVVHANRVLATSPAARAAGVARRQRRREAQSHCPALVVLDHDPARDARAFEPIVAALDAITPRVEITVPGQVAFPTRGPSRFFGGDDALVERILGLVPVPCRVGVADGPFAAALAARTGEPCRVVAPGATPAFLAELPLAALEQPDLVDVLTRLGIRTLGALAALPAPDVLARFGIAGQRAWRLAGGLDEHPPATAPPPPDLTVSAELDPPADTVAPAAFVARGLAEELHRRLWARGSACTRVVIGAETDHGERLERVWRAEGALTAAAMADRLRWQLDGWIGGPARHRPTAGISRLWLAPDEVVPAGGRQLGFWGTDVATGDRAARAVARVRGLLGDGAVAIPEWRGSRDPATAIALVDVEAVDLTADRAGAHRDRVAGPWPGRLPTPSPARVHVPPVPAEVVDEQGRRVQVSGRGALSAAPHRLSVDGGTWREVAAWAGPWLLDERWWDAARHRRRARLQLLAADGQGRVVTIEAGAWAVEATYD